MAIGLSGVGKPALAKPILIPVSENHPIIQLDRVLPWGSLIDLVVEDLKKTTKKGFWNLGRTIHVRTHLACYLLQKFYDYTDRQIASQVAENGVYRRFSGEGIVDNWKAPHFTKIEEFRNRLSPDTQLAIANELAKSSVKLGFGDPSNVDIDSTVQEVNITYPTDAKLMVQLSEKVARIYNFWQKKAGELFTTNVEPLLKDIRSSAKSYFFQAKNTAKEVKQEYFAKLHKKVKQSFTKLEKELQVLSPDQLQDMPWNIKKHWDQIMNGGKKYLSDVVLFIKEGTLKKGKRLSHHAKEVACIVKGKAGKPHEFGRVFQLMRLGGNFIITAPHTSVRMDDKSAIAPLLKEHQRLFNNHPILTIAADKGYYSTANEKACVDILPPGGGLHLGHHYEDVEEDLDRALRNRRAGIEPLIGHIKHGGQLKRSRMKSDQGSLAAGYAAMAGYNLRQLVRCQMKSSLALAA